jgi:hypothetical protein
MRWMIQALLFVVVAFLMGCTRINDAGAPTGWYFVTQDEMDGLSRNATVGPGRGHVVGLCCDGESRKIYEVVGRNDETTQVHEFCHLIDDFHGDWHAALESLTDRRAADWVPPEFETRYARLSSFVLRLDHMTELDRMTPFSHWAMLAMMFPDCDTIQHPDIIDGLKQFWPNVKP